MEEESQRQVEGVAVNVYTSTEKQDELDIEVKEKLLPFLVGFYYV